MKKLPVPSLKLATAVLALGALLLASGAVVRAQIVRLDLEQMTLLTDNAVVGAIVDKRVIDLGNEVDGYGLYYTIFTIEGESLYDGRKTTVDIAERGGWIDEQRGIGCWDSEAPGADEAAIGKRVVAYYMWVPDIGRGVGANRLYASHGGFYRTVDGPTGVVVMGRGDGYAIEKNTKLASLRTATRTILDDVAKTQAELSR
jgi:hypothetical protein